jgi:hypothetical protein
VTFADDEDAEKVDPLVESVEDECPTCGAWMLNPALHRDWHKKQDQRFHEIAREASRYKSPPTYGGGSYA